MNIVGIKKYDFTYFLWFSMIFTIIINNIMNRRDKKQENIKKQENTWKFLRASRKYEKFH